ncbi:lipase [Deinococcus deserti]|uniref:Putative lipase n=1 Tax=Deinococcus deserti (strain DSM 17065 / CIP 109153 / LMG 22923 / VCD115) TaxID=546414 RepID=C1D1J6_DEIDV|nr:lipase [Deinococcus deserti]ACO45720.1 putative lipase, precursor [Deinococcus deserti VCD115]
MKTIRASATFMGILILSACGQTTEDSFSQNMTAPKVSTLNTELTPPCPSNPILFVHGYNSGSGVWDTMKSRFMAAGYPDRCLSAFNYTPKGSNRDIAKQIMTDIETALEKAYGSGHTSSKKVDIVAVSMGSLSSRYYIRYLMKPDIIKVGTWVSLAGPNHGTKTTYLCSGSDIACTEMKPGSAFLTNSVDGLNYGGDDAETPYDKPTAQYPTTIRYGTWRSKCDFVINPVDSVVLKQGAYNYYTPKCISHGDFVNEVNLYEEVKYFLTVGPLAKSTSP